MKLQLSEIWWDKPLLAWSAGCDQGNTMQLWLVTSIREVWLNYTWHVAASRNGQLHTESPNDLGDRELKNAFAKSKYLQVTVLLSAEVGNIKSAAAWNKICLL